ncbi:MAG: glycosyltransferase family 4 protein [Ketobacteraceae bacterium]|nr:glycosyltransferase family 4 protein [Ketobacteraceae bacterium]
MEYKHDICFVGLKCYDLLARAELPRYLGGIERVLVTLARGLVKQGVRVAFITYDEGQRDGECLDGITVYKAYDPDSGIRGLRFIHPRMTSIWAAMRRADAGAYIQMGAGVETFVTRTGAHWLTNRRRFIYCIASDANCDPALPAISSNREKRLFLWGLRHADKIVSQTRVQAERLRKSFGLDSVVVPMPFEQDPELTARLEAKRDHGGRPQILWVGRVIEVKRLDRYLELAERMPGCDFHIVGAANAKTPYAQGLVEQARAIPNVTVHGKIPDLELLQLYQDADLLCCTSDLEGFPTTFLEAWSFRKPVVTTFDPDGVVATHELGLVCEPENLQDCLERMIGDPAEYDRLRENGYDFYRQNYTLGAIAPKYIRMSGLKV